MRHLFSIIFLCLFSLNIHAQYSERRVTGKVTDTETKEALPYVSCKVMNQQEQIVAFSTTNTKGEYSVAIVEDAHSLVFSLIGYKDVVFPVKSVGSRRNVGMDPTEYVLKEVAVTPRKIEQREDTVKYNVSAFRNKTDKYLEDVLKKMPGIAVSASGDITYKGEGIGQFTIEGQNLLGSRYNQATRNMPVDAIAQVQVVENDQPIHVLKGRKPSSKATLNIKLKKGFLARPFGEWQGGIGLGLDKNTIWDNKLTLIMVGRKNQMLMNASMNNNGKNLSTNTMSHIGMIDFDNRIEQPENLLTKGLRLLPPTNENRYLQNKSYSVGLNHLRRLGRYGNLRTNITYYGNSDVASDSTSRIYGGAYDFSLYEANRHKATEHTIAPEWKFEINAPKVYMTDELSGMFSYSVDRNRLNSNSLHMSESNARHPFQLQNRLQMTLRSGRKYLSLKSIVNYYKRSEQLNVRQLEGSDTIGSSIVVPYSRTELSRFLMRNSASTGWILWGNSFELKYGMEYARHKLGTDSIPRSIVSSQYSLFKNNISTNYHISFPRNSINIELPVNLLVSHLAWKKENTDATYTYISPSVSWRYNITPMLRFNFRASIGKDISSEIVSRHAYYSSYRSLQVLPDEIGWIKSSSVSMSAYYANFSNMVTWSITGMASRRKADHYNIYSYRQQLTEIVPTWQDAVSSFYFAGLTADKTLTRIDFQIKTALSYTRNEIPLEQNGMKQDISSNALSANLLLMWDKVSWLVIRNSTTFNITWQDRFENRSHNSRRSIFNIFQIDCYPLQKLNMQMSLEQNTTETDRGKYSTNIFLDVSAKYVLNKRTELSLRLSNLLNRKQYEDVSFSGLTTTYLSMPLRGRELLFILNMNI